MIIKDAFAPDLEDFSFYEDEDCALGTARIFGVRHHVTFVKTSFNPLPRRSKSRLAR